METKRPPRRNKVQVSLTDEQLALVRECADKEALSLASFIRKTTIQALREGK